MSNPYIVEGPPKPAATSNLGSYLGCLVALLLLLGAPFIVMELTRKFSDRELAQLERDYFSPYVKDKRVQLPSRTLRQRRGKIIMLVPSIWSESGKTELDETYHYLPPDYRADKLSEVGTVVFVRRYKKSQNQEYEMQDDKSVKNFKVDTTTTTVYVFDRKTKGYFGSASSSGLPKNEIRVKKDQNQVDAGGGSEAHNMVKFLPDIGRPY